MLGGASAPPCPPGDAHAFKYTSHPTIFTYNTENIQ